MRRAYIAASRRSDRSLEARIESARRASEIHKKRTGRALRVTEQDVINEEMYSEEDEEYPAVYRGLTQHLRTGSSDWNRRLNAYLTNHVAMRSALDQALMQSYNGPRNGIPFGQNTMYPSGFMQQPQMIQQPQLIQHQQLMPHTQMMHSPHMIHAQNVSSPQSQASHISLRQQPYPSPTSSHRHHGRSMSMHIPHQPQGIQVPQYQDGAGINLNNRRSSIAVTPISSMPLSITEQTPVQTIPGQMSPIQISSPQTNPTLMNPAQMSSRHMHSTQITSQQLQSRMPTTFEQTVSPVPLQSPYISPSGEFYVDFPLSGQLPPETQAFLQPSLDANDPLYSSLMGGSYGNPAFPFDNDVADLKPSISDTSSHSFELFDFSTAMSPYSICSGTSQQGNFESPYCPPHSTAATKLTPLKVAAPPPRQITSGDKLEPSTSDEEWNSFLNVNWVADAS